MNTWFWVCNSTYIYNDELQSVLKSKTITWPKIKPCKEGDIIYFYMSAPFRAILYKTIVVDRNVDRMDAESNRFVSDPLFYQEAQAYVRVELCEAYPGNLLGEESLRSAGVTVFQSSYMLPSDVAERILQLSDKSKEIVSNSVNEPKSNVLTGLVGAIAGGLLSTAVWFVLFRIHIVSSWAGLISAILVFKGYTLGGKVLDKKGKIVSIIVLIITIYIGVLGGVAIMMLSDAMRDITWQNILVVSLGLQVVAFTEHSSMEAVRVFGLNLLMAYAFAALGSYRFIKGLIKKEV